jgi:hypothetical protein
MNLISEMDTQPAAVRSKPSLWVNLAFLLLIFASLALWWVSLQSVDVSKMNDLGLVSVLQTNTFLALGILTLSFFLALRLKTVSSFVLFVHLIALIFMLYGITTLVEEIPRFESVYKHVGIVEYILRTHHLDTKLNAYFSWPSFFILGAFLTNSAGYASALSLAPWASFFFNLLYLAALLLILKGITNDRRVIWSGLWFYFLANWVGQDYFSPQSFNYFLYLVVVGILIYWFRVGAPGSFWNYQGKIKWIRKAIAKINTRIFRSDRQVGNAPAKQQIGLLVIVFLIMVLIVSGHQLTPFALLSSLSVLVIFKRIRPRSLPVILGILIAAWMVFMTTDFLKGHSDMVIGSFGEVHQAVSANVTNRVQGSQDHLLVVYLRVVMSAGLWGLAALGAIRRFAKGFLDLTPAILALAPFSLFFAALYGGEMLLRVYFFSLPAAAFFAAAFFFPDLHSGLSWFWTFLLALVSLGLLAGFMFTRYGNERMDYFSRDELAAVNYLYSVAKPDSQFVVGSVNMPWRYRDLEKFHVRSLKGEVIRSDNVEAVQQIMANKKYASSYLILTRSQIVYLELFRSVSFDTWVHFTNTLFASKNFQVVYGNHDAVILMLADDGN